MELTFKVPANLILAVLLVVGLSGCQSLSEQMPGLNSWAPATLV